MGSDGDKGRIKSKIAQVRVYPGRLTSKELLHIQKTSRWDRPIDPPAPPDRLDMYVRQGLPKFHCYGWEEPRNYEDARASCESYGQVLARIEPGQEHVLLNSCPPGEYFIGADDKEAEGTWKWVSDGSFIDLDSTLWRKDGDGFEPNVRLHQSSLMSFVFLLFSSRNSTKFGGNLAKFGENTNLVGTWKSLPRPICATLHALLPPFSLLAPPAPRPGAAGHCGAYIPCDDGMATPRAP